MTRWKAAALHLLLSAVVISAIAAAALLLWYPHGLWRIAGLDRLMGIMLAVDVTAGPLLTLAVYRTAKPGLRRDLATISLVQAAFLLYGLHTLWLARPVFLIGSDVRFNLVFANEVDPADLAMASRPEWRRLSWSGPVLAGVLPPASPQERGELLTAFLERGRDQHVLPQWFVPYAEVVPAMLARAQPADGTHGGLRAVPVMARGEEAVLLVDARSGLPRRVVER